MGVVSTGSEVGKIPGSLPVGSAARVLVGSSLGTEVVGSIGTIVDVGVGVGVVGGAVEAGSAVEVGSGVLDSNTAVVVPVGPGPKPVSPCPGVREYGGS